MIKPINKNVLLKEKNETNASGIYMPKITGSIYEVIATGKNVSDIKPHDIVIIKDACGKSIRYQNEIFVIIEDSDILGIVEE